MSLRSKPSVRPSVTCFLFMLMLAVFSFGLHARIELVRSGASTTPSKISVQKRSATEVVAESVNDDSVPPEESRLLTTEAPPSLAHSVLQSLQLQYDLRRTARLDSDGLVLMLRPPPIQL